jgi:type I restriction enzyme S subunit
MKLVKLGDITENLDKKRIPLNASQREAKGKKKLYPYVGANNVLCYIDDYIFDEEILCIAEDGGGWGSNQTCAIIYNEKCWVNNHAHVQRATEGVNLKYIKNYLNFANLNSYITGATRGKLTRKYLDTIKIPLPSTRDQTRIATLLSKVESLIAGRKKSIADLDELLKSTFLEMFGPVNPEFEKWPIVKIKDLAADHKGAMRTGPFGSNLLHSEFTKTGEVAVLGIDNAVQNRFSWGALRFITHEKYEKLKNYRIFPEDVIVTIMGTVGRSAVIPKNIPLAINTKHLAAITFDKKKANPIFMSYAIHSSPFIINQFINRDRGAIMSGLNLGIIKDTQINKPPIELQNQFATIVEKVEALKEKYQNSLNDLETLYGALSQKAFKGELDLSRIAISEELKPKDIKMDAPQVRKPDLTVQDESVKTQETREQFLMSGRRTEKSRTIF